MSEGQTTGNSQPAGSASTALIGQASSAPLDSVKVSSEVQNQLKKESPLDLLASIPQHTPILDPQKMANEILAKQQNKNITTETPPVQETAKVPPTASTEKAPVVPDGIYEQSLKQHQQTGQSLLENATRKLPPAVKKEQSTQEPIPEYKVAPENINIDKTLDDALKGELKDPAPEPEKKETKPEEDPLADIPEELPEDDTNQLEENKATSAKENFKKLRSRTRLLNEEKNNLNSKLEEATRQLEAFKTGAATPEVIQQKDQQITELTKYRDLVDLKLSPEYEENFVKPLNDLGAQLEAYVTEYQMPTELMYHALTLKEGPQLSRFLSEHFDPAAALAVKGIVQQMQTIQTEARTAEQQPAAAFQKLKQEHQTVKEIKETQRINTIHSTAKNSWAQAVNRIQEEGQAQELVWNPNNSDHNEKYVQVFRNHAAKEYGKIIKYLADNGITQLDPMVAEALARSTLLSVVSANAILSRNAIAEEANALESNTSHLNSILRPGIGSSNGTGNVSERINESTTKPAPTPAKEGARLLQDLQLTGGRV